MFRLVRLMVFCLLAFAAGILHERWRMQDRCEAAGGQMTKAGLCTEG